MSINPLAPGHCLVVPRREVDHWVDLSTEEVHHLFTVAHQIAQAQRTAFPCEKVGMIIAGYEVPHTHIHLIPTTEHEPAELRQRRRLDRPRRARGHRGPDPQPDRRLTALRQPADSRRWPAIRQADRLV
jgi:diadenosine tetraphosphate (Ap4A) HIT family hydrolase